MNSEPPVSTSKQRTVLVTGATNGLGRALVGKFAQEGAHVLIHGRYAQRAEAVRDELAASTGNQDLDVVVADLADLHQVRQLAHDVPECCEKLDILINNAGISSGPPGGERQENPDGIEMRFAVNYLASYYLTRLLLPLLRESAPSHIVNIASAGQHPIDFDDPMLIRNYSGTRAYARKRCEKYIASSRVLGLIAAYPMIVAPRTPPTKVSLLNAGCLGCAGGAGFCEMTRTFLGRTALGASLTMPIKNDSRISSASSEWPTSA